MLEAAVKFTISNSAIATVTEDTGLIVAMKPGQATVTGQVCEIGIRYCICSLPYALKYECVCTNVLLLSFFG